MAHLSGDEHLIQAFRNGVDVHAATASKIFGIPVSEVTREQRGIAKTANFGIMYGISSFGLAQRLHLSRSAAKELIDGYFDSFPSIRNFIDGSVAFAKEHGYVETLFGRRRYLPDILSRNATIRSLAERNAVNAPIQGTSADIIKLAMIGVAQRIEEEGLRSRMVLQIHDELVFDALPEEVPQLQALVKEVMEHVLELSVPLTVECSAGASWLEAH
jgi:DNA polymerase-1